MKRLIIATLLLMTISAKAQKLVIGSKMPEWKSIEWLSPLKKSDKAIFVEFYQSNNPGSAKILMNLESIYTKYGSKIQVVILTREHGSAIDLLVMQYGSKFAIGYDASGREFEALGVKFLPFSMLFSSDKELYWQGNQTKLTTETLDNVD
ncbi:MAG: hypothetical protein RR931_02290 [Mucinivorans sp.]